MPKNLVIVESPSKAKTIEGFLGKDYVVKSSVGHIRDMPKKDMGVDIENNFQPLYVITADKKKIVADLKKSIKNFNQIYLATDDDREGEAIAWHLKEALSLDDKTPRIAFQEITKDAIIKALKSPRNINKSLVDSQQARRIIDRLVGFEISPILWRKVSGARSAGRVQSPVVRLVVEREREIDKHTPECSFKSKALLSIDNGEELEFKLKKDFKFKEQVIDFANDLLKADLTVKSVDFYPSIKQPKQPFITSTLQQESSQRLGFSVKKTMNVAQNLYREGYITYMRTDSFNLSNKFILDAKEIIKNKYGEKYYKQREYKTKSAIAQEAHEAIRPTNVNTTKVQSLDDGAEKLYALIYKRAIASQMSEAKVKKSKIMVNLSNREEVFLVEGETLEFAGFLEVYDYANKDDKLLPDIEKGAPLKLLDFNSKEYFSKSKPRYTEASLVSEIEKMGIGRPSTFANMVSTVQDRKYVVKETRAGVDCEHNLISIVNGAIKESKKIETAGAEKNKLFPTNVAYLLVDFLVKNFENIIGYEFTAKLENNFDKIAKDNVVWQDVIREFYDPFHEQINSVKDLSRDDIHNKRELGVDPSSGRIITASFGRYGAYVQIGNKEDEEKPKFASLKDNQNIDNITIEEALELFKMPRKVGKTADGEIIKANYGPFGPYIQYGKNYVSLKEISPEDIDLQNALELIAAKKKADAERLIKSFEGSDIQILNGRFGAYIWNGKKRGKGQKNITIKKFFGDKAPAELTLEDCEKAISGKLTNNKAKKKKSNKKKS